MPFGGARTFGDVDRRRLSAGFPALKTLESYDFTFASGALRPQIQELARLGFVERSENVVLLGRGGVGKRHLAIRTAGAHRAWKVQFISVADLVIALEAAQRRTHQGTRCSPRR